ncbi:MAG: FtsQ-type POTRA domain-containing protein [Microbacteriaceae bacterium]|nr:FtsQ-type POTRA domain-containing protein [Microbacteriaceae bacterium]
MRRFTRRSRRRRVVWTVTLGIIVAMATLVAVAVYSPLLALKTIQIDGTSRLNPDDIHSVVDGQLGTPLALIDFDRITEELGDFPLVRSYVTETVPPHRLIIHIVEREPVGSLATGSGFDLVDPAGVVIERSQARIPGVPLIDIGGAGSDSAAFDAAVEVLIALPEPVLVQLDTIVAGTRDDVQLTLAGGGAKIIWGSADDSAIKARILAAALAQNYPNVIEYNVSAPGQLTYR